MTSRFEFLVAELRPVALDKLRAGEHELATFTLSQQVEQAISRSPDEAALQRLVLRGLQHRGLRKVAAEVAIGLEETLAPVLEAAFDPAGGERERHVLRLLVRADVVRGTAACGAALRLGDDAMHDEVVGLLERVDAASLESSFVDALGRSSHPIELAQKLAPFATGAALARILELYDTIPGAPAQTLVETITGRPLFMDTPGAYEAASARRIQLIGNYIATLDPARSGPFTRSDVLWQILAAGGALEVRAWVARFVGSTNARTRMLALQFFVNDTEPDSWRFVVAEAEKNPALAMYADEARKKLARLR